VISKTHAAEPFEVPEADQVAFWRESMAVAKALEHLIAWDKRPLDRLEMAAQSYQAAHRSADLVEALLE
jgi:hypothetical protein